MDIHKPTNVTGTGIAVALAVIVALGLLFLGPRALGIFFTPKTALQTQDSTSTTTTMQDSNTTLGADSTTAGAIAAAPTGIPANVTQLMSKDEVVGTGAEAKTGDSVTVQYVGMFTNGTVFDASANHGTQGFTFNLGAGQVIKGWDEGVVGMKVGGKRELVIPASLGYGSQVVGPIPANSTLVFQVELLDVKPAK